MLDGLWIASAAPAVEAALASMAATGPVAVLHSVRLARALAARGRAVVLVAPAGRYDGATAAAVPTTPTYAALIGQHSAADGPATLAAWMAAVCAGGGVVMVDRAAATELSRRALCAGLTALEQRVAGRWTVTSGVVTRL
ncbi:MAG: hypothetical protein R3B06_27140 [Kofleriaceae bacterium]